MGMNSRPSSSEAARLPLPALVLLLLFATAVMPQEVPGDALTGGPPSAQVSATGEAAAASPHDASSVAAAAPLDDDGEYDLYKRLYDFGVGKRAYTYVSEYKRLPVYNFGLGKRATGANALYSFGLGKRGPRTYSFGLGKRGDDEPGDYSEQELYPELDGDGADGLPVGLEADERELPEAADEEAPGVFTDLVDKRGRFYSFGLGKRVRPYSFGLGKRAGPATSRLYSFGLGKREGRLYSFGLGKRPLYGGDRRFSFGLGKRAPAEHRFSFGLGKRDPQ
uniref:Allatostatin-A n=1 Tax=Locusta migratoria TaxID=7004 RepID=A0A0H3YER6_LOCMI|nr:allatostatin-A precursor [Locusta migratoria]